VAVCSGIEADHLEEHLRVLRRARANLAVHKIQERSLLKRLDEISEAEIEAEIQAVRHWFLILRLFVILANPLNKDGEFLRALSCLPTLKPVRLPGWL